MYGVVCKLRMAPMLSSQDICSTRDRWIRESIKRIHIQFWAVLGSQGCTEKKIQTSISMLLLKSVFLCFGQKKFEFKKNHCSDCSKRLHNIKVRSFFMENI